jgi:hypothetical protein
VLINVLLKVKGRRFYLKPLSDEKALHDLPPDEGVDCTEKVGDVQIYKIEPQDLIKFLTPE